MTQLAKLLKMVYSVTDELHVQVTDEGTKGVVDETAKADSEEKKIMVR